MQELTPKILATVADRRTRGRAWEHVAKEVGWKSDPLRESIWNNPTYLHYYRHAEVTLLQESEVEMILILRMQMRDEDKKTSVKAAAELAKYLASKHRDHTRCQIEHERTKRKFAKENIPFDEGNYTHPAASPSYSRSDNATTAPARATTQADSCQVEETVRHEVQDTTPENRKEREADSVEVGDQVDVNDQDDRMNGVTTNTDEMNAVTPNKDEDDENHVTAVTPNDDQEAQDNASTDDKAEHGRSSLLHSGGESSRPNRVREPSPGHWPPKL